VVFDPQCDCKFHLYDSPFNVFGPIYSLVLARNLDIHSLACSMWGLEEAHISPSGELDMAKEAQRDVRGRS